MNDHSALSVNRDDRLAEVLDAYLAALEAGTPPDVEELLARYPDLAGDLKECLASLAFIRRAEVRAKSSALIGAALSAGETAEGVLGDFRIVREVGRGGMGVVYEAEQVSLRRRVALKVLPFAATMDPRHLRRFQNEAQAAACLHHTNIVPVYSVGCERGVHFYAMQFIDGLPLSELIRQMAQGPSGREERTTVYQTPPNEAITAAPTVRTAGDATPLTREGKQGREYFRRVAELGVQAAEALDHAHQLGIVHRDIKPGNLLLDGRGNLWITDFGLAQVQHSEANLTLTGDLVGTLRYMSPEQALAKRVVLDHRTDVYSLGVTLYELLVLQPAFPSNDRQELLRQVAFEEPVRPRRLNKAIPPELETIVLKAMEKRPQDRYVTAQALGDDLERWLRHEPIQARRPTVVQRAIKWGRRHRPVVAAGAVVLLMALGLGVYIAWTRHDRAVRQAAIAQVILAALQDSQDWQEQRRLPEALSAARRADGLLAGAEVEEALHVRVRARLADLELLDRLENVRLEMAETVKEDRPDLERTDRLYGKTFRDAGLDVESLTAEEAGERIRRSTVKTELAAVLDGWAVIRTPLRVEGDPGWQHLFRVARAADADPWRTRMREALEQRDFQALAKLAASDEVFRMSSIILITFADVLQNEGAVEPAETLLREAQRRRPDDFWLNDGLYQFYKRMRPPRWDEALRFAAVEVALRPGSPGAQLNLGNAMKAKGRLDEALAEYRRAIQLKTDYAEAHNGLGNALELKGRLDEAIAAYQEAIRLKTDYAEAHNNLGLTLHKKGQQDEAIAEYQKAIRLKKNYAVSYYNLGVALKNKGQLDEAIAAYREAIRLRKDLAEAHNNLGNALRDKGQLDEAIAEFREALKKPFPEAYKAHDNLGNALRAKGRFGEAIAAYREAIRLNNDYAESHNNLGVTFASKGQLDEAIAEFREANRLQKDDAKAHGNLGTALQQKGRLDEAIAEYREAIRLKKDIAEVHMGLGSTLRQKGRFAEALVCYRQGHELGSRTPRWLYPSARMVRDCERLVELDGKLSAILSGQKQPADTAERLALAQLCQMPCKMLYAAAQRFYRESFTEKPQLADDLDAQHRYNAACASALAGCGQGKDADKLDAKERAHLRQQALEWLRADVKAYRQMMEKSADKAGLIIAQRMQHWLQDTDFAGVRSLESLARLPEVERKEWQKLWADVTEMLAQVQRKPLRRGNRTRNSRRAITEARSG